MKGIFSFDTLKSFAEATENSAGTAQSLCKKEECTIVGGFACTVKNPTKQEKRKYIENT